MIFSRINPKALKLARPDHNLKKLMLSAGARRAAISFLTIFSQIYVFEIFIKLGYSMVESLIFISIYLILLFVAKFVALNLSEDLSRKIGFKSTIRLSLIPFFLYIALIILAEKYIYLVWIAPIVWGMHAGFFWWGYHGYFIKTGSREHFGESLGEAGLLEIISSIAAPLLGAVIIDLFGFNSIFITSALFMLISLFLLGKDHEERQKVDVSLNEVMGNIIHHKSVSLAYIGSGGEAILYTTFWPLFLYITYTKLLTLGWIITLANVLAAIFAIWFGRQEDKRGERRLLKSGTTLMSTSWFARLFFSSISFYVLSDFIRNLGEKMVSVPLNTLSYKKAFEGKSSARAILFRETALVIGVISALLLFIIFIKITGNMNYWFILPMIFILLPFFSIIKKKDLNI